MAVSGFGGKCDTGHGVHGESTSSRGVVGTSDKFHGVYGHSKENVGVAGESDGINMQGVLGISHDAKGAGVLGTNDKGGDGVIGKGRRGVVTRRAPRMSPQSLVWECYNPAHGESDRTGKHSSGVKGRANKSCEPAQACRRGACGPGQVKWRACLHGAPAQGISLSSQAHGSGSEGAVGKASLQQRSW